jgi:hypothetical protein
MYRTVNGPAAIQQKLATFTPARGNLDWDFSSTLAIK